MSDIQNTDIEPHTSLDITTIKKRAVAGVIALTSRTFLMQAVAFVANIFLTIFLLPSEYGTFAIVNALLGFLNYFSNVGLAAALIQKKENPTQKELATTFTIQQLLVLILISLIFVSTPLIQKWQQLSQSGVYLLWAMCISLIFPSLKTIPSVLLERRLEFKKLIIPEIIETFVFSLIVVIMAWRGYGVTSYTLAVLARGGVGLVAMYIIQPWRPSLSLDLRSIKSLLKFGIPYQINSFLALIKDEGLIIFLGGVIGPVGVGFYRWAKTWGEAALRFFMDQVIRVTFPAYSRLQNSKEELSSAVSRSIFFICLMVFPSIAGLLLLAPDLTIIIPKYEKWQPAIFALTIFGINAGIAAVTTPLTNLLNAIGKIKTTFKLMVMWTALTWIFVPFLAYRMGLDGSVIGVLIVGITSFIAIAIAYKNVPFDIVYSVGKPLLATIFMSFVVFAMQRILIEHVTSLTLIIVSGFIIYAITILALVGQTLIEDFRKVFGAIIKK